MQTPSTYGAACWVVFLDYPTLLSPSLPRSTRPLSSTRSVGFLLFLLAFVPAIGFATMTGASQHDLLRRSFLLLTWLTICSTSVLDEPICKKQPSTNISSISTAATSEVVSGCNRVRTTTYTRPWERKPRSYEPHANGEVSRSLVCLFQPYLILSNTPPCGSVE